MINVDDLIKQVKLFFLIPSKITFNLPEYSYFHDMLLQFIYENHYESTDEWKNISKNLLYRSNQYMSKTEANDIIEQLEKLRRLVLSDYYNPIWDYIHPRISSISKDLFNHGHYSNAVEDAFIEINDRVKNLFQIVHPDTQVPDGVAVMNRVFSPNTPLIQFCDLSDETGKNTQMGYMQMLSGAMSALRNPKAHSNNVIITKEDAVRQLLFASMLMFKIDEAVKYSNISE